MWAWNHNSVTQEASTRVRSAKSVCSAIRHLDPLSTWTRFRHVRIMQLNASFSTGIELRNVAWDAEMYAPQSETKGPVLLQGHRQQKGQDLDKVFGWLVGWSVASRRRHRDQSGCEAAATDEMSAFLTNDDTVPLATPYSALSHFALRTMSEFRSLP